MGAWFISVGLVAAMLGQTELDAPNSPADAEIAEAISQLGAAKFSVRRRASQFLWQQGLAAEPALLEAVKVVDREVRSRAQHILSDFAFGILPGVPADVVALIRQFRDGPTNQRPAVLQRLVDRNHFEAIQRLIRLEPDLNIRRQLLVSLMQNPKAVERFFELDRLEQLVAAVGADSDETWRRKVLAELLFSPKVIQQLAEKKRLDVLAKIVEREKSPDVRRDILSMLFQNPAAVASLIENNQLQFVLQAIVKEPEENTRGEWISQLLGMSGVIQQLSNDDRLEKLLKFAQDNVGAEQRSKILQQLFRDSSVLKTILEKRGVERLIAMTAIESDAAARGGILAALVTSMAVREHLTEAGQYELAIKLARQEKDPTTRNEYLTKLLTSMIAYSLTRNESSRTAIWALIKSDPGTKDEKAADWRGVAILRIVTGSSGRKLLEDKSETAWLMRFLREDMTPNDRATIVERLVMDSQLKKLLLEHKHFDVLLDLAKQLPPSQRGRAMGQLFAASDPFGSKVDPSRTELTITLAKQETDPTARRQYLQVLFHNQTVMTALISGGFYDDLWTLIGSEKDPLEHAILRGDFLNSGSVVKTVVDKQQLEDLLTFAQEAATPEIRHEYLKRLFTSSAAMSALIEKGHYDALFAMASDDDKDARVQLLCQFYSNPQVVERLIETESVGSLLDFAQEHAGDKRIVSFLQRLFFNSSAVTALVEQGRIATMLSLSRQSKDRYLKASLMRSVFGSSQVVKHFADKDQLSEMCELINGEDAEVRYQVYYNMTIRSDTLEIFVQKEWIDDFLETLKTQVDAKRRGQLMGRVVVHSKVIKYLAEHEQLDRLIQLASELDDANARHQYLSALFSNSTAVGMLIDRDNYDVLYRLASSNSDPGRRAQLRASLLTNSKAIQHLVAENKIELLLQLVDEQTDQATRQSVVARITYSPTAVAALIEHGEFDRLVQLCRAVAEPRARRRMLSALLQSGRAIDQLASSKALEQIVVEVLQETDQTVRRQTLQQIFSRSDAIGALVRHGHFDRLFEVVESETDATQRRLLLGYLVTSAETVQHLATLGKISLLLRIISEEPESSRRRQYLTSILYKPDAVRAIAASGQFSELLETLLKMPNDANRGILLSSLLSNVTIFEHLVDNGELDRLIALTDQLNVPNFNRQLVQQLLYSSTGRRILGQAKLGQKLLALLQAEPDSKHRESYARQILSSEHVWQALVSSSQVDVIYEAAKWVPDEAFRQSSLQRMLYAPSGLIAHCLERGEIEKAEGLLEEHADSDLGRLRQATYLLASGQIDERIAEVRQRIEATPEDDRDDLAIVADRRLLVYLLRAAGNLPEACETAELLDDPGLLRALCVEAGRWSRAAELCETDAFPLPIPSGHLAAEDVNHRRVEQLGIVAAYQRLAGDTDACEQALSKLRRFSSPSPFEHELHWLCIEAFLLNSRVDEGLELTASTYPSRAFELYVLRHEYDRAFELAGWKEDTQPNELWLHSLPTSTGGPAVHPWPQIEFAIQVARALHAVGKTDSARQVIQMLDAVVGQQVDGGSRVRSQKWENWGRLVGALLDMNDEQTAWELAAHAAGSSSANTGLLPHVYSRRSVEAGGWWRFLGEKHSPESMVAKMTRLHHLMRPSSDSETESLQALIAEALELAESSTSTSHDSILLGVGRTCFRRRDFPMAIRFTDRLVERNNVDGLLLRADALRSSQQWDEAAEAYYALWQIDHSKLSALYLSGDALKRVGRLEDGQQRIEQSLLMALDSKARMNVALDLIRHGLRDEADKQLRLVLRTAPFEHSEWNEAARHLGEALEESDPTQAIELLERSLLDDLRTWFYLLNNGDYLRTPAKIHRLRAAVAMDAGEFDAADDQLQLALAAMPGDIELAEQLTPKLEQAGRQQQADLLFERVLQPYARAVKRYPESGLLNNDIAWLMARCSRRLHEALRHAEKAVRLAPNNASYLDTLAEVHFRLGDRDTAIQHSSRAVDLQPESATLREQLHRFQKAELPETIPPPEH